MDFALDDDQRALVDAIDALADRHAEPGPPEDEVFHHYADELDVALEESGFFSIAAEPEYGILGAALAALRLGRLPRCVEFTHTAIVAPELGLADLPRPIAVATTGLSNPIRWLGRARTLLWVEDHDVCVATLDPEQDSSPCPTPLAYPYGVLRSVPDQSRTERHAGAAGRLFDMARLALALEAQAAMDQALAFTVEYVGIREQFGRPIGAFQAVAHRLAQCAEQVESARWLALRAAGSLTTEDACIAAAYVQQAAYRFTYDMHQFNGAMGLTLETPLHCWTYRLKALLGELSGPSAQLAALADARWPTVAGDGATA